MRKKGKLTTAERDKITNLLAAGKTMVFHRVGAKCIVLTIRFLIKSRVVVKFRLK